MPNYDANSAEVAVFTYKDGLLSAVAHDLKIKVGKFSITADGGSAKGEFDAGSLVVVNAMKDGAENPGALPASGPDEIKKTIKDEILNAAKNPTIKFDGKIAGAEVVGNLTLNGTTKEVKGSAKKEGGKNVAEFKFDQRDFGLKPYSAMLGTLKIKPEVTVRVTLPG
jgi:hypothetical protein